MLESKYSISMRIQALYGMLCIAWNGVVIWQVQNGVDAIGPTGSNTVIVGAVVLVALLAFALRIGWESLYMVLAGIVGLLAASAVYSSTTNGSDLWPSEFWQIAGITINVIGVVSFIVAIFSFARGRTATPSP